MEKQRGRALVIGDDRLQKWREPCEKIAVYLSKSGFHVDLFPAARVTVPQMNAVDLLLFQMGGGLSDILLYGRSFEALSGLSWAGKLGGIFSTVKYPVVEAFKAGLEDTEMTTIDTLYTGDDVPGTGKDLSLWLDRLLAKHKEMIDARHPFTR